MPSNAAPRRVAGRHTGSPEDRDVLSLSADEGSVHALHGQRRVIVAISNRLILAAVHFMELLSDLL